MSARDDSRLPPELLRVLDQSEAAWSALDIPAGTLGVILGSGLGGAADGFGVVWERGFAELGLPEASVAGHKGRLILAEGPGAHFLFLQGRLHRYEGLPDSRVLLPAAAMARLPLAALLVTNAAGGLDPAFRAGEFMLIRDILSFQLDDPLRGAALGGALRRPPRRPLYDSAQADRFTEAAAQAGVRMHEGVLACATGPAYETQAEIRLSRTLGAGAASMSTFPESLLLATQGVPSLAMSCITNEIKDLPGEPLTHDEVVEVGRLAAADFAKLLAAWSRIGAA